MIANELTRSEEYVAELLKMIDLVSPQRKQGCLCFAHAFPVFSFRSGFISIGDQHATQATQCTQVTHTCCGFR